MEIHIDKVSAMFRYREWFWDIRVQRIAKLPLSQNYGEIRVLLVRLYWLREVFYLRQSSKCNEIFIQIRELVRKISTDIFFHTDRQTDRQKNTHTHTWKNTLLTYIHTHARAKLKSSFLGVSVLAESEHVLSSTSNFWRYSNTSIVQRKWEWRKKKEVSVLNYFSMVWG